MNSIRISNVEWWRIPGVMVVAWGLSLAPAPAAWAQGAPEHRFFVSLDGGYQFGSQQVQTSLVTGQVFGEDRVIDADYSITRDAGLFRANVAVAIAGNLGFGFGYNRSTSRGSADVTVSVPHPVFPDRPRMATGRAEELAHRENLYHFQVVYVVPVNERLVIQLFGGPTAMNVDQGAVVGAVTTEVSPVPTISERAFGV